MRILCCYTQMHPAAAAAIRQYAPTAELVDVTGDDYAYWREIRARWQGTGDLILIEQDIEILPESVASMAACEHDWCCYAYPIFRNRQRLRNGLGCTKFSARAQRLVGARRIAEGFALCTFCKGQGCWFHLDGRISEILKLDGGLSPHVHGDVIHHHDYSGDLPIAAPEDAQRLLGDLVEVRGKAIEHYDENWDPTPAVVIADYWPRREMYAMNARQACAIAEDLHRLAGETGNEPGEFMMPAPGFATDKVAHGYLPAYSRIARHLGPAARVCEIGVASGGSLDMWRVLFPQGTVAGVDIDPHASWPEGSIAITAAQDDPGLPRILDSYEEAWDLIVDDASHDGNLTAATLDLLWKLVAPGGFYVIEDWFTGFANYRDYDDSMLRMARSLLGRLDPFAAPEGHYTDVESIEYRHGLAILRKAV
jgi:hypothetical protein